VIESNYDEEKTFINMFAEPEMKGNKNDE
jgi:hypothetical protein